MWKFWNPLTTFNCFPKLFAVTALLKLVSPVVRFGLANKCCTAVSSFFVSLTFYWTFVGGFCFVECFKSLIHFFFDLSVHPGLLSDRIFTFLVLTCCDSVPLKMVSQHQRASSTSSNRSIRSQGEVSRSCLKTSILILLYSLIVINLGGFLLYFKF